jgi:hypothetical protein
MKQIADVMSDEELLRIIRNAQGLPADAPITDDMLWKIIKQDEIMREHDCPSCNAGTRITYCSSLFRGAPSVLSRVSRLRSSFGSHVPTLFKARMCLQEEGDSVRLRTFAIVGETIQ